MAKLGRPKAELTLRAEEREALQRLARRRLASSATVLRARIVLRCSTGVDLAWVALAP
jgi:hypothetical protein